MNPIQDDALDALLRKHFDGPIPDDGFSRRVLQRLPQRRRRRATWPLWSGVFLGAIASWLALASSPLLHIVWREGLRRDWSAPAISVVLVMAGMAMLALAWSVAEATDH